jgi:hypothetical protein
VGKFPGNSSSYGADYLRVLQLRKGGCIKGHEPLKGANSMKKLVYDKSNDLMVENNDDGTVTISHDRTSVTVSVQALLKALQELRILPTVKTVGELYREEEM